MRQPISVKMRIVTVAVLYWIPVAPFSEQELLKAFSSSSLLAEIILHLLRRCLA